jgi:hypothetical protein
MNIESEHDTSDIKAPGSNTAEKAVQPDVPAGSTGGATGSWLEPELEGCMNPPSDSTTLEAGSIGQVSVHEAIDDIQAHGFVPAHRKFQQLWWWEHKPWSYAQLFIWMLMNANHQPKAREHAGRILQVNRGVIITSKLAMHQRSGLARSTIDRFMDKMTEAGEIQVLDSGPNGQMILLCNYESYTRLPPPKVPKGTEKGNRRGNP